MTMRILATALLILFVFGTTAEARGYGGHHGGGHHGGGHHGWSHRR